MSRLTKPCMTSVSTLSESAKRGPPSSSYPSLPPSLVLPPYLIIQNVIDITPKRRRVRLTERAQRRSRRHVRHRPCPLRDTQPDRVGASKTITCWWLLLLLLLLILWCVAAAAAGAGGGLDGGDGGGGVEAGGGGGGEDGCVL